MLVLSRKVGERIIIGSGIEVVVTRVRGSSVQLGVKAPDCVPIHRDEVYRRVVSEENGHADSHPEARTAGYAELP